jgi:hypothetical protein
VNRFLLFATGPKPEEPESGDPEAKIPLLPFESAYVHNCASNSFPMKLIFKIIFYSSPGVRLIMQRVCSKFQVVLAKGVELH